MNTEPERWSLKLKAAFKIDALLKVVAFRETKIKYSERNSRKNNFMNEKGKESIERKNKRGAKCLIPATLEKISNALKS